MGQLNYPGKIESVVYRSNSHTAYWFQPFYWGTSVAFVVRTKKAAVISSRSPDITRFMY